MNAKQLFKQIQQGYGWIDELELVRVCEQENLSVAEAIKLTKLLSDHDMIGAERLDEKDTSLVGMARKMVKEEGKGDPFAPNSAMVKRGIDSDEVRKAYKVALREVENYILGEIEDMVGWGDDSYTFNTLDKKFKEGDGWFEGTNELGGNKDVFSGFDIKKIYFEFEIKNYEGSYDSPADSEIIIDRKSIQVEGAFMVIEDDRGAEDPEVERWDGMALIFKTGVEGIEDIIEDIQ